MCSQFTLYKEGNDPGETNGFLLGIREASHLFAFNNWLAIRPLYMPQNARGMADQGNGSVSADERLDQRDRNGILGQVPERTMAAWIEDAIEVIRVDGRQLFGRSQLCLGLGVCLEAVGRVGPGVRLVALGVVNA